MSTTTPRGHSTAPTVAVGGGWASGITAIVYQDGVDYIALQGIDGTVILTSPIVAGTAELVIDAALAYSGALGGGETYVGVGVYNCSTFVTIGTSNATLSGSGRGTHLNEGILIDKDCTDVVIRDLAVTEPILYNIGAHRLKILDVTTLASAANGIFNNIGADAGAADFCLIQGYTCLGATLDGIGAWGQGWRIAGCYITVDDEGISCDVYTVISDCVITGCDYGITTGEGCVISGNYFYDNITNDIYIWDERCVIDGNICYTAGADSIYLDDYDFTIISNNVIITPGGIGIYQYGGEYCVISGNTIENSTDEGIYADDGDYSVYSNNTIWGAGADGLYLDADECTCTGNFIKSSTDAGIFVFSGNNVISANFCENNGANGITGAAASLVITGNQLYNNTGNQIHAGSLSAVIGNYTVGGEDGINLPDGVYNVLITGNYCRSGGGSGISLTANNNDCYITNNYLYDHDDYGIEITAASCNDNVVKYNYFWGNDIAPVLDSGTDTVFECLKFYCSEADDEHGAVPGKSIINGQFAYVGFNIPDGMHQIMGAHLHVIPDATQAAADWDVAADYGANGEAYNNHNETDAAATYNVTQNLWFEVDIFAVGLLAAAASDDAGGVSITVATVGHDVTLCFLHIDYV